MPYRLEPAKTERGKCTVKSCKESGITIAKDTMKFGVLVEMPDNQFFAWRHWGCVTPAQIKNLKESMDDDGTLNYDWLDGYEDMPDEDRARIRQALADGHVADEDAIGQNHPSYAEHNKAMKEEQKLVTKLTKDVEKAEKKGDDDAGARLKKQLKAVQAKVEKMKAELGSDFKPSSDKYGVGHWIPKAKLKEMEAAKARENGDDEPTPAKKKRANAKKAVDDDAEADEANSTKKPTKKRSRSKKNAGSDDEDGIAASVKHEEEDEEPEPAPKRRKNAKVKAEANGDDENVSSEPVRNKKNNAKTKVKREEEEEEEQPAPKGRRTSRSKVKQEAEGDEAADPVPKKRRVSKGKATLEEDVEDEEQDQEEVTPKAKRGGRKKKA